MGTSVSIFDHPHQLGEPATSSIAGLPGGLAALLVVAGNDHAPPRALPDNPADPHSNSFNRGFKANGLQKVFTSVNHTPIKPAERKRLCQLLRLHAVASKEEDAAAFSDVAVVALPASALLYDC